MPGVRPLGTGWASEGDLPGALASAMLLVSVVLVLTTAGAVAATQGEVVGATPEDQYAAARHLLEKRSYLEAAAAFRQVADSEQAGERLRAQALYSSGLMLENARQYERAVSTYQEVQSRFPGSEFAIRAKGQQETLTTGGENWIAFRRRWDAAWDERVRAANLAEARLAEASDPQAEDAALEKAGELFGGLLRDFGDQPNASSIAMALGETHMLLRRFREAREDYRRAIELARAQIDQSSSREPGFDNLLLGAEEKLTQAEIALRRQRITASAWLTLALVSIVFLAIRPWRSLERSGLPLAGGLAATTILLAAIAAVLSYVVRNYVDETSPLTEIAAVLLVVAPGLAGEIVALGVVWRLSGSGESAAWPTIAGSVLGVVAASAVAICLVDAFALYPFLDSML